MHFGPILGRIWSFWVISDSFHIVFSAVSGRFRSPAQIKLSSIGNDPETTRVVGCLRSSRFSFLRVFSVVQGRLTLLKRPETTQNDPRRPETSLSFMLKKVSQRFKFQESQGLNWEPCGQKAELSLTEPTTPFLSKAQLILMFSRLFIVIQQIIQLFKIIYY